MTNKIRMIENINKTEEEVVIINSSKVIDIG